MCLRTPGGGGGVMQAGKLKKSQLISDTRTFKFTDFLLVVIIKSNYNDMKNYRDDAVGYQAIVYKIMMKTLNHEGGSESPSPPPPKL